MQVAEHSYAFPQHSLTARAKLSGPTAVIATIDQHQRFTIATLASYYFVLRYRDDYVVRIDLHVHRVMVEFLLPTEMPMLASVIVKLCSKSFRLDISAATANTQVKQTHALLLSIRHHRLDISDQSDTRLCIPPCILLPKSHDHISCSLIPNGCETYITVSRRLTR